MSFSSEVKEELSRHLPTARHCQIAETAAILSLCGQISEKDGTIRIQTENAYVARKYFTLLKKTFNIEAELAVKLNQKENTYLIHSHLGRCNHQGISHIVAGVAHVNEFDAF